MIWLVRNPCCYRQNDADYDHRDKSDAEHCGGIHMTAGIEFRPDGAGTHYIATVLHPDRASRERHEAMGFHDGWGTVIEQLVEIVTAMKADAR